MPVTIYDVAKAAGVSTATVSKVLSGQPYISEKTRAKVRDAVELLNYVPNAAAQGLAGARTNILGMVVSYDSNFLFSDPHLLQILQGINEVVTENNCALLLSTATADDRLSAYRRLLAQRYIDGAIVEGSLGEIGYSLLQERGYPVVAVGYSDKISCVHADDFQGAQEITAYLIGLGHRRIGIISGPASDRLATAARYDGYRAALHQATIPLEESLRVFGTFRTASGYAQTEHLMALTPPPTAIFAFNDRMAAGALRWLREHGYQVPQDVSVAGFDDTPVAARCNPPLTTVRQLSYAQGRGAATLLFRLIQSQSLLEREEVSMPTSLVVRASTAPPQGGTLSES
ncbi:MAG: LacI family DNA-binding transcriptional regulator [Ardenticatenales bacterium]|nr:LacI family DNA-binding transcriptional regulator [Ardenticatenales bacterium]